MFLPSFRSKAVSGDGMAIGATNTTLFDGLVGPIDVIGTFIRGESTIDV